MVSYDHYSETFTLGYGNCQLIADIENTSLENKISLYREENKTLHLQGLEGTYTLYIYDQQGKLMHSTNDASAGIATSL